MKTLSVCILVSHSKSFIFDCIFFFNSNCIFFIELNCIMPSTETASEPTTVYVSEHTPTWEMLPPPINDRSFATIEEAIDWIREWAAIQGYGISKGHSWRNTQGILPKVRFRCQRGQGYRDRRRKKPVNDTTPSRNTTHLSTDCPFAGELCFDFFSRRYSISQIINHLHNHEGAPPEAWTSHRQREMRRHRAEITSQIDQHISNRLIHQSRRTASPGNSCISTKDLANFKQKYRKQKLDDPSTGSS